MFLRQYIATLNAFAIENPTALDLPVIAVYPSDDGEITKELEHGPVLVGYDGKDHYTFHNETIAVLVNH